MDLVVPAALAALADRVGLADLVVPADRGLARRVDASPGGSGTGLG